MPPITSPAGLCGTCAWARRVESARGSTFLRCGAHDRDASLPKYPPLPRHTCHGYQERANPGEMTRD